MQAYMTESYFLSDVRTPWYHVTKENLAPGLNLYLQKTVGTAAFFSSLH